MEEFIQDIAKQTAVASKLNEKEQAEIRRELISYLQDFVEDLQLQGNNNEIIMEHITSQFGEPERIGQQMYAVHRRLERIPFIGPVLYYRPLIAGLKAMIIFSIALGVLMLSTEIITTTQIYINTVDMYPHIWKNRVLNLLYSINPIAVLLLTGAFVGKKIVFTLSAMGEYIEALFVAYLPAILIIFVLALDAALSAATWKEFAYILQYSWISYPLTAFTAFVACSLVSVVVFAVVKNRKHKLSRTI